MLCKLKARFNLNPVLFNPLLFFFNDHRAYNFLMLLSEFIFSLFKITFLYLESFDSWCSGTLHGLSYVSMVVQVARLARVVPFLTPTRSFQIGYYQLGINCNNTFRAIVRRLVHTAHAVSLQVCRSPFRKIPHLYIVK